MGKLQARLDRGLKLYVRQLAWLHATPRPDPRSKRAQLADKTPALSRIDQLRRDRVTPAMPPNDMPHVIDRLLELGLVDGSGMSAVALSWREIEAWKAATGIDIPSWEARLLRRLSTEYVAEIRRAESESCPPPWRTKVTQRERDSEEARLRAVLG